MGLVRRPHVDQHAYPSKRGKAIELGRFIEMDDGRSMRAVKDSPASHLFENNSRRGDMLLSIRCHDKPLDR